MKPDKTVLGCSSTTSNTVLKAKLGMYPLEIKWGGEKVEIMSVPKERLPTIAKSVVCEKVTRGRAGIRWDNVVAKI